ncbi:MAG: response regulator [Oligoflexia bacterium]|nr:response regulator [Oligoflexia bacterium]
MQFSAISTLVVDDSIVIRLWTVQRLKELGVTEILQCDSGNDAFRKLDSCFQKNHPVHLILSDWRMDNGDGAELLKNIRADQRFKNLPFIMITAESDKRSIAQAISLGVSSYLIKPFETEALKEKIIICMEKNEIQS